MPLWHSSCPQRPCPSLERTGGGPPLARELLCIWDLMEGGGHLEKELGSEDQRKGSIPGAMMLYQMQGKDCL